MGVDVGTEAGVEAGGTGIGVPKSLGVEFGVAAGVLASGGVGVALGVGRDGRFNSFNFAKKGSIKLVQKSKIPPWAAVATGGVCRAKDVPAIVWWAQNRMQIAIKHKLFLMESPSRALYLQYSPKRLTDKARGSK